MLDRLAVSFWAWAPYLGIAVAVLVAGFFGGAETGAYRLNRVRLRLARADKRSGAELLGRLIADMPALICVTLLGQNLAVYIATDLTARLWHVNPQHSELYAEVMATVTLAPIVFVFAEIVPKDIFNTEADRLMYPAARPLWMASVIFRALGFLAVVRGVGRLWNRISTGFNLHGPQETADPFPARARLQAILRDSAAEGLMTPYQNELVEKILSLRDIRISTAMIPATKAVTIRMDAPAEEFRRIVESCPYSRLPVLDPGSGDVVGTLRVFDVLREMKPEAEFDLTTFLRLALDLPETMTVAQAMFAMQSARLPMAIVRDAKGTFLGLITLKDMVEEIVGELAAW
jgi:putative hemolysin